MPDATQSVGSLIDSETLNERNQNIKLVLSKVFLPKNSLLRSSEQTISNYVMKRNELFYNRAARRFIDKRSRQYGEAHTVDTLSNYGGAEQMPGMDSTMKTAAQVSSESKLSLRNRGSVIEVDA